MAKRKRSLPSTVRVNFDMDRPDWDVFKKLCEASDTDASKALRQLVRSFVKQRTNEKFGKAIVKEEGMEKLRDPEEMEVENSAAASVAG